jgi:hypothetical protein
MAPLHPIFEEGTTKVQAVKKKTNKGIVQRGIQAAVIRDMTFFCSIWYYFSHVDCKNPASRVIPPLPCKAKGN